MKPKPFIQVNINLSSCFTEETEVLGGFCHHGYTKPDFVFPPVWPGSKPLCSLPFAGHNGIPFLYVNASRESKVLPLVSPPTLSITINVASSP